MQSPKASNTAGSKSQSFKTLVLAFGIAVNLAVIGYFKYANFLVDSINAAVGSSYHLETIVLPLAISFFTFQQIAYLVDAYKGKAEETNFLHYCLFVTFFPQLIAGPIVLHKEMLPQFAKSTIYRLGREHLAVGLTIFLIGLFKKVVLADGVAAYATPVFDAAAAGFTLTFFESWGGALAYTFQLYFDFSGYSDMAIGLARMIGVRLPLNFHSPYKANNIIEFWRRWHMTLSRFLRDYLYIPLGGNRNGPARRHVNLMITMLLGGLWHGAGWTFVVWGALHGTYLVVNHVWRSLRRALGQDLSRSTWWGRGLARLLTFNAVVVGWVFFRADSFEAASTVLRSMAGENGVALPEAYATKLGALGTALADHGVRFQDSNLFHGSEQVLALVLLLLLVMFAPNTQQVMMRYRPALETYAAEIKPYRFLAALWQPTPRWAVAIAIIGFLSVLGLSEVTEFLYFQF